MKAKYNLDKLVKVKTFGFRETKWYYFSEGWSFLGIKMKERGFYTIFDQCIGDELPHGYIFKNGKVLDKPEVQLSYQGGYEQSIVFETLKEAQDFEAGIIEGKPFLSMQIINR